MSEPTSIRDQIEAISVSMRDDPPPSVIRGHEVALAGLLWRVNKELIAAEIAFRRAVNESESDSEAGRERIAKGGDAYARFLEAQVTQKSCMEMLRTCRSSARSVSEEMRLQR